MVAKRWTDEQFKELWDAYGGAAAMSAGTGVDVRTIYKEALEAL